MVTASAIPLKTSTGTETLMLSTVKEVANHAGILTATVIATPAGKTEIMMESAMRSIASLSRAQRIATGVERVRTSRHAPTVWTVLAAM